MSQVPQGISQRLVIGLILMGIVARLVPHPPNVTPVMAIALFGGAYLARRWAILLPLAILIVTDAILGWHATIAFTWGAFLLTGALGWWIRRRPNVARTLCGALGGSVLFFIITNFGVWAAGTLYPPTMSGLWQCYVAAIPFFRNTRLGDLSYTTAIFGMFALVTRARLVNSPARSG